MNILERAHSLTNLNRTSSVDKGKSSPVAAKTSQDIHGSDDDEVEEAGPTDREYETESDSSRTEGSPRRTAFTQRDLDDNEGQSFSHTPKHAEHRPLAHHPAQARSWYEFDLAVVAALVSPVGQWLTGGDYIKSLLLVLLLVFYLHQIIEIPWTLYYNARPRVRPQSGLPAAEDFHARRASSELRFLEFIFFSFAVVSPFLGAYLLRYVTFAVTGQDIHSWFSLGLFVLATGVRPWSHLVQRFNQRVTDLHDIVHYHSSVKEGVSDDVTEMKQQLERLHGQIADMQKSMTKLKKKLAKETNEVFDYVDEQVEPVEKMVKKHEKALDYVLRLPASLLGSHPSKSNSSPKTSIPNGSPSSSTNFKHLLHSPNHSGASSPTLSKLETIHEAIHEGMDAYTRPKTINTLNTCTPKTVVVKSPSSPRATVRPMVLRPFIVVVSIMTLPMLIFVHIVYAATFPLRRCLRMFLRFVGVEKTVLQFYDAYSSSFRDYLMLK
ncbi:hypothetical protein J3R30DRAFT_3278128 [Lentinula aciculospora]|uniref:Uncharacterized protein n=1 Tax=Lentinula aciculospora TaxID=153920 RepID=A0A9W9AUC6_9AGAR|nr:hypothetical protein J3R30DRAFT_3278128 [Lentinula aciculospora]